MKPYEFNAVQLTALARVTPSRISADEVGTFPVYSPEVVLKTLQVLIARPVAVYWEPGINGYDYDYMMPSLN